MDPRARTTIRCCCVALPLLIAAGGPPSAAAQDADRALFPHLDSRSAYGTAPGHLLPERLLRPGTDAEVGPAPLLSARPGEVGLAPWLPDRLDAVVREAIADGATPGAAVVVGRRGRLVVSTGYGRLDWHSSSPPVTDATIYDLASLTKVVATTTLAMSLVEEGRLGLDDPVHAHLSRWPSHGFHGRVTVRHLLEHTSGLPAGTHLWRREDGPHEFLLSIAELPLRSIPGAVEHYSDVGMIVLGLVLERASGISLDLLARERIFQPLGMWDTRFQPLLQGLSRRRIAPTEVYRGEHLRGIVHDPNAYVMGGVAGHAGLFSSARDLARFAAALLWEAPGPVVCRRVLRRFATPRSRFHRYALGWETPFRWTRWGDYFSPMAVGHTGYTGTGIWIDPEHDLFVVLLTNRVNPTARNRKHLELRREVQRAVRDAIVEYGPRAGWLGEDGGRFADAGRSDGAAPCREEPDPAERLRRLLPVLRAATLAAP